MATVTVVQVVAVRVLHTVSLSPTKALPSSSQNTTPNYCYGQPRQKSPNLIAGTVEKNSPKHPGALYPRGGECEPFPTPPQNSCHARPRCLRGGPGFCPRCGRARWRPPR